MVTVDPYWIRLRRLRDARDLSQLELSRLTADVSYETIRALERDPAQRTTSPRPRSRYPSAATLERVARALEVEPEEFPEYRLARARLRLNDRETGLDEAVAALDRIERDLLS